MVDETEVVYRPRQKNAPSEVNDSDRKVNKIIKYSDDGYVLNTYVFETSHDKIKSNDEQSSYRGSETISIVITQTKQKKQKKPTEETTQRCRKSGTGPCPITAGEYLKIMAKNCSTPDVHKAYANRKQRKKISCSDTCINRSTPFNTKFIVNTVALEPHSVPPNCQDLLKHPLMQAQIRIYRCHFGCNEEKYCQACNSDAFFDVLKGLYDCYNNKNCENCNCILCSSFHKAKRKLLLGEASRSKVSVGVETVTTKLKAKETLKRTKEYGLFTSLIAKPTEQTEGKITARSKEPLGTQLEKLRKAQAAGILPTLEGYTSVQREKTSNALVQSGSPLHARKKIPDNKVINQVRKELGLPMELKPMSENERDANVDCSVHIAPFDKKTQRETIIRAVAEKRLTVSREVRPTLEVKRKPIEAREQPDKIRKALAAGLLTPNVTPEQKEMILSSIDHRGICLDEGKTLSERKLIEKIRKELCLTTPITRSVLEKLTKPILSRGHLFSSTPVTPEKKRKLCDKTSKAMKDGKGDLRICSLVRIQSNRKSDSKTTSPYRITFEKVRAAETAGLFSQLQGKSKTQKEKVIKSLANQEIPFPEAVTPSEKKIAKKIRAQLGLPPAPSTKCTQTIKHDKVKAQSLITPAEGKTVVLRKKNKGSIEAAEQNTPSTKEISRKVKSASVIPTLKGESSEQRTLLLRKLKATGLKMAEERQHSEKTSKQRMTISKSKGLVITPERKNQYDKAKMLRRLAKSGLPLPEGRTASDKELIKKIRTEMVLPLESITPLIKEKLSDARTACNRVMTPTTQADNTMNRISETRIQLVQCSPQKQNSNSEKSNSRGFRSMNTGTGHVRKTKGVVTQSVAAIREENGEMNNARGTCEMGCGCDKKKIRFKHSYVKIRVTSPDTSSFCSCSHDCPGIRNGALADNEGIKVTVETATGLPTYKARPTTPLRQNLLQYPVTKLSHESFDDLFYSQSHISLEISSVESNYTTDYSSSTSIVYIYNSESDVSISDIKRMLRESINSGDFDESIQDYRQRDKPVSYIYQSRFAISRADIQHSRNLTADQMLCPVSDSCSGSFYTIETVSSSGATDSNYIHDTLSLLSTLARTLRLSTDSLLLQRSVNDEYHDTEYSELLVKDTDLVPVDTLLRNSRYLIDSSQESSEQHKFEEDVAIYRQTQQPFRSKSLKLQTFGGRHTMRAKSDVVSSTRLTGSSSIFIMVSTSGIDQHYSDQYLETISKSQSSQNIISKARAWMDTKKMKLSKFDIFNKKRSYFKKAKDKCSSEGHRLRKIANACSKVAHKTAMKCQASGMKVKHKRPSRALSMDTARDRLRYCATDDGSKAEQSDSKPNVISEIIKPMIAREEVAQGLIKETYMKMDYNQTPSSTFYPSDSAGTTRGYATPTGRSGHCMQPAETSQGDYNSIYNQHLNDNVDSSDWNNPVQDSAEQDLLTPNSEISLASTIYSRGCVNPALYTAQRRETKKCSEDCKSQKPVKKSKSCVCTNSLYPGTSSGGLKIPTCATKKRCLNKNAELSSMKKDHSRASVDSQYSKILNARDSVTYTKKKKGHHHHKRKSSLRKTGHSVNNVQSSYTQKGESNDSAGSGQMKKSYSHDSSQYRCSNRGSPLNSSESRFAKQHSSRYSTRSGYGKYSSDESPESRYAKKSYSHDSIPHRYKKKPPPYDIVISRYPKKCSHYDSIESEHSKKCSHYDSTRKRHRKRSPLDSLESRYTQKSSPYDSTGTRYSRKASPIASVKSGYTKKCCSYHDTEPFEGKKNSYNDLKIKYTKKYMSRDGRNSSSNDSFEFRITNRCFSQDSLNYNYAKKHSPYGSLTSDNARKSYSHDGSEFRKGRKYSDDNVKSSFTKKDHTRHRHFKKQPPDSTQHSYDDKCCTRDSAHTRKKSFNDSGGPSYDEKCCTRGIAHGKRHSFQDNAKPSYEEKCCTRGGAESHQAKKHCPYENLTSYEEKYYSKRFSPNNSVKSGDSKKCCSHKAEHSRFTKQRPITTKHSPYDSMITHRDIEYHSPDLKSSYGRRPSQTSAGRCHPCDNLHPTGSSYQQKSGTYSHDNVPPYYPRKYSHHDDFDPCFPKKYPHHDKIEPYPQKTSKHDKVEPCYAKDDFNNPKKCSHHDAGKPCCQKTCSHLDSGRPCCQKQCSHHDTKAVSKKKSSQQDIQNPCCQKTCSHHDTKKAASKKKGSHQDIRPPCCQNHYSHHDSDDSRSPKPCSHHDIERPCCQKTCSHHDTKAVPKKNNSQEIQNPCCQNTCSYHDTKKAASKKKGSQHDIEKPCCQKTCSHHDTKNAVSKKKGSHQDIRPPCCQNKCSHEDIKKSVKKKKCSHHEIGKACCQKKCSHQDLGKTCCQNECSHHDGGLPCCQRECSHEVVGKPCCQKKCSHQDTEKAASQNKCSHHDTGQPCCQRECSHQDTGKLCCQKKCSYPEDVEPTKKKKKRGRKASDESPHKKKPDRQVSDECCQKKRPDRKASGDCCQKKKPDHKTSDECCQKKRPDRKISDEFCQTPKPIRKVSEEICQRRKPDREVSDECCPKKKPDRRDSVEYCPRRKPARSISAESCFPNKRPNRESIDSITTKRCSRRDSEDSTDSCDSKIEESAPPCVPKSCLQTKKSKERRKSKEATEPCQCPKKSPKKESKPRKSVFQRLMASMGGTSSKENIDTTCPRRAPQASSHGRSRRDSMSGRDSITSHRDSMTSTHSFNKCGKRRKECDQREKTMSPVCKRPVCPGRVKENLPSLQVDKSLSPIKIEPEEQKEPEKIEKEPEKVESEPEKVEMPEKIEKEPEKVEQEPKKVEKKESGKVGKKETEKVGKKESKQKVKKEKKPKEPKVPKEPKQKKEQKYECECPLTNIIGKDKLDDEDIGDIDTCCTTRRQEPSHLCKRDTTDKSCLTKEQNAMLHVLKRVSDYLKTTGSIGECHCEAKVPHDTETCKRKETCATKKCYPHSSPPKERGREEYENESRRTNADPRRRTTMNRESVDVCRRPSCISRKCNHPHSTDNRYPRSEDRGKNPCARKHTDCKNYLKTRKTKNENEVVTKVTDLTKKTSPCLCNSALFEKMLNKVMKEACFPSQPPCGQQHPQTASQEPPKPVEASSEPSAASPGNHESYHPPVKASPAFTPEERPVGEVEQSPDLVPQKTAPTPNPGAPDVVPQQQPNVIVSHSSAVLHQNIPFANPRSSSHNLAREKNNTALGQDPKLVIESKPADISKQNPDVRKEPATGRGSQQNLNMPLESTGNRKTQQNINVTREPSAVRFTQRQHNVALGTGPTYIISQQLLNTSRTSQRLTNTAQQTRVAHVYQHFPNNLSYHHFGLFSRFMSRTQGSSDGAQAHHGHANRCEQSENTSQTTFSSPLNDLRGRKNLNKCVACKCEQPKQNYDTFNYTFSCSGCEPVVAYNNSASVRPRTLNSIQPDDTSAIVSCSACDPNVRSTNAPCLDNICSWNNIQSGNNGRKSSYSAGPNQNPSNAPYSKRCSCKYILADNTGQTNMYSGGSNQNPPNVHNFRSQNQSYSQEPNDFNQNPRYSQDLNDFNQNPRYSQDPNGFNQNPPYSQEPNLNQNPPYSQEPNLNQNPPYSQVLNSLNQTPPYSQVPYGPNQNPRPSQVPNPNRNGNICGCKSPEADSKRRASGYVGSAPSEPNTNNNIDNICTCKYLNIDDPDRGCESCLREAIRKINNFDPNLDTAKICDFKNATPGYTNVPEGQDALRQHSPSGVRQSSPGGLRQSSTVPGQQSNRPVPNVSKHFDNSCKCEPPSNTDRYKNGQLPRKHSAREPSARKSCGSSCTACKCDRLESNARPENCLTEKPRHCSPCNPNNKSTSTPHRPKLSQIAKNLPRTASGTVICVDRRLCENLIHPCVCGIDACNCYLPDYPLRRNLVSSRCHQKNQQGQTCAARAPVGRCLQREPKQCPLSPLCAQPQKAIPEGGCFQRTQEPSISTPAPDHQWHDNQPYQTIGPNNQMVGPDGQNIIPHQQTLGGNYISHHQSQGGNLNPHLQPIGGRLPQHQSQGGILIPHQQTMGGNLPYHQSQGGAIPYRQSQGQGPRATLSRGYQGEESSYPTVASQGQVEDPNYQAVGPQGQIGEPYYPPTGPQGQIEESNYPITNPQGQMEEPSYPSISPQGQVENPNYPPISSQGQIEEPYYAPPEPQGQMEEPNYGMVDSQGQTVNIQQEAAAVIEENPDADGQGEMIAPNEEITQTPSQQQQTINRYYEMDPAYQGYKQTPYDHMLNPQGHIIRMRQQMMSAEQMKQNHSGPQHQFNNVLQRQTASPQQYIFKGPSGQIIRNLQGPLRSGTLSRTNESFNLMSGAQGQQLRQHVMRPQGQIVQNVAKTKKDVGREMEHIRKSIENNDNLERLPDRLIRQSHGDLSSPEGSPEAKERECTCQTKRSCFNQKVWKDVSEPCPCGPHSGPLVVPEKAEKIKCSDVILQIKSFFKKKMSEEGKAKSEKSKSNEKKDKKAKKKVKDKNKEKQEIKEKVTENIDSEVRANLEDKEGTGPTVQIIYGPQGSMTGGYPDQMPGYADQMSGRYIDHIPGTYPDHMSVDYPNQMTGDYYGQMGEGYPDQMEGYHDQMESGYPDLMQAGYSDQIEPQGPMRTRYYSLNPLDAIIYGPEGKMIGSSLGTMTQVSQDQLRSRYNLLLDSQEHTGSLQWPSRKGSQGQVMYQTRGRIADYPSGQSSYYRWLESQGQMDFHRSHSGGRIMSGGRVSRGCDEETARKSQAHSRCSSYERKACSRHQLPFYPYDEAAGCPSQRFDDNSWNNISASCSCRRQEDAKTPCQGTHYYQYLAGPMAAGPRTRYIKSPRENILYGNRGNIESWQSSQEQLCRNIYQQEAGQRISYADNSYDIHPSMSEVSNANPVRPRTSPPRTPQAQRTGNRASSPEVYPAHPMGLRAPSPRGSQTQQMGPRVPIPGFYSGQPMAPRQPSFRNSMAQLMGSRAQSPGVYPATPVGPQAPSPRGSKAQPTGPRASSPGDSPESPTEPRAPSIRGSKAQPMDPRISSPGGSPAPPVEPGTTSARGSMAQPMGPRASSPGGAPATPMAPGAASPRGSKAQPVGPIAPSPRASQAQPMGPRAPSPRGSRAPPEGPQGPEPRDSKLTPMGPQEPPPRPSQIPPVDPRAPSPRGSRAPPMGPQGPSPRGSKAPPMGPQGPSPRGSKAPPMGPQGPSPRGSKAPPMGPQGPSPRGSKAPPMGPQGPSPRGSKAPPIGPQGPSPRGSKAPPMGPLGPSPRGSKAPPMGLQGPSPRGSKAPPMGLQGPSPRGSKAPPMGLQGLSPRGSKAPPMGPQGPSPRGSKAPPMGPQGPSPRGSRIQPMGAETTPPRGSQAQPMGGRPPSPRGSRMPPMGVGTTPPRGSQAQPMGGRPPSPRGSRMPPMGAGTTSPRGSQVQPTDPGTPSSQVPGTGPKILPAPKKGAKASKELTSDQSYENEDAMGMYEVDQKQHESEALKTLLMMAAKRGGCSREMCCSWHDLQKACLRELRAMKSDLSRSTSGFQISKPKRPLVFCSSGSSLSDSSEYAAEYNPECSRVRPKQNKERRPSLKDRLFKRKKSKDGESEKSEEKSLESDIPEMEQLIVVEDDEFKGLKLFLEGKGGESPGLSGIFCFNMTQEL